jgi:peroxiredoxin
MMRLGREGLLPQLAFIRVEGSRDAAAVDAYFAARKPGFTVHRDPQALVGRAFDATAYPTYVLVDRFGHVRYRGPYPEDDDLIKWVDALADEKADPGPQAALFGVTALAVQKLLDETRLPSLAGETKPLRQYLGPGGLLAVFVDTRCPFSGEAIADMPKVAAALARHQASSVLVNIGDKPDAVREFYTKKNLNLPVVHDGTVATQKAWQVYAVPTVVLFDAKGEVAYRGKAAWADLAKAAENALKLPPGSIKFDVKGTEFG